MKLLFAIALALFVAAGCIAVGLAVAYALCCWADRALLRAIGVRTDGIGGGI